MPVILPFGYGEDEVFRMEKNLQYLFEHTSVSPEDLTFVPKVIPSKKVESGQDDQFLFVFASDGWMQNHGLEFMKILAADHEVCVSPLRVYKKGWDGDKL